MGKKKKETGLKDKGINDSKRKAAKEAQAKRTATAKIKTAKAPEVRDNAFHVVGMSASAGGLEAFEQFFRNAPPNSGAAFILVPHLDPTHKSIMVDLIKRCTKMEVLEAGDGMQVQPDCVYIIPPNSDLALLHRRLQLIEPVAPRGHRHPIDYFLRTLAEDQGERAVCIILSGTGSDGTVGLKAIKGEGGMVMVQDPATAKYDGMPRSAIDTGLVDYVLPPNKMPEQLIKYVKHSRVRAVKGEGEVTPKTPDSLQKIFILLRSRTGNDFSLYKKNTVIRRIERRMNVHQIERVSDYVRYMQEHRHEVDVLFKELIIGVTNFFRDKEAFDVLKAKVCPHLFGGRSQDDPVRIWVVGCSTGEEAYSIAITLRECIEDEALGLKVQIFATDIDEGAIETARAGVYPESIAVDVSPERLKRFFTKEGDKYRVNKGVREVVVFAPQNVIKDPPFSKLDMISCRNLLIYLDGELQKKILPLFHYTLKPGGILFLGSSETVGGFFDLFEGFDKKWKFFKRKELGVSAHPVVEFPTTSHNNETAGAVQEGGGVLKVEEVAKFPVGVVERVLLDNYAPPCAVIDQGCEIVYIVGRTGRYLEPASGEARMNVLAMAREGLRGPLQQAVRRCVSQNSDVTVKGVRMRVDGGTQLVDLYVKPVRVSKGGLMMVLFEESRPSEGAKKGARKGVVGREGDNRGRMVELEQELRYAKENLQTTIEELEAANEELKSTNEELQSTNEEFQSTNEELETSKEETQSLNEELITVNSELQTKIDDLMQSNNDLKNLLDSTQIATIFLDNDMRIRRFTPEARKVINLIDSDIGRPVVHISSNLVYEGLIKDIGDVMRSLAFVEREVETKGGEWYLMRVLLYRTTDNMIDGVVITFVDIDEQRKTQAVQDARVYAESVVDTVREALLILDSDLRVVSANRSFYDEFRVTKEETENKLIYELGNYQWDIPRLRELLEEITSRNTKFNDFKVEHKFERVGTKTMLLNARRIDLRNDRGNLILLAIQNITDPKGV